MRCVRLSPTNCAVHLIWRYCAGHYAHALEHFRAAAAHFSAAASVTGRDGAGSGSGWDLAGVNQALAVLCERGPGCVAQATEILKQHAMYDSVSSALPAHDRFGGPCAEILVYPPCVKQEDCLQSCRLAEGLQNITHS
jgi:hypothetical protein